MAIKAETKTRLETVKTNLRRGRHAYIGLHGLAYDRFQMRREQVKSLRANLFNDLAERGETTVKQAEVLIKHAQKTAWTNYSGATEKLTEALPVQVKSRVEVLEDELANLQATFDRLSKTAAADAKKAKKTTAKKTKAAPKTTKKTVAKAVKATTKTAKPAVAKVVKAAAPKVEAVVETTKAVPAAPAKTEEIKTPRHIPYFNDVKRYDPLASEDVVRKIVNHCGIALRSEDARYVACSDEAERVTVRESWLKRKLALTAVDADLDKKVKDVCDLMQRDQKKNRVTFYYLLAKKERLLDTL